MATYRIVVSGHLGDGFARGLSGVSQRAAGSDTVLEGEFIDQSHLHSLLDQLRGLGLEVTNFSTFSRGSEPEREPDGAGAEGGPLGGGTENEAERSG